MSVWNQLIDHLLHHYHALKKLKIIEAVGNIMARNPCIFNEKLDEAYPCMEPVPGKRSHAYCSTCKEEISLKNKGKKDIEQHCNPKTFK